LYVIRPCTIDDLDALVELALLTNFGLTTLPKDRELLRKRVLASTRHFEHEPDRPGGEDYLFVMQQIETGMVVGTCAVVSKVGGFEPFYAYRVQKALFESNVLNVRKEIDVLHLLADHDGPTEIGSLFLRPSHRHSGLGRFLSLSRFLFMAEFPQRFDPTVIAELRGVIDERGQSDFWDAVGRHFFEIEFPDADYLCVVNRRFIADLMPKHPIYVPLLPPCAQAVIGKVHERTKPALRLLESEGFKNAHMVDIFEAGPVLRCPFKEIRTIKESAKVPVLGVLEEVEDSPDYVICNTDCSGFRVCVGPLAREEGGVRLTRRVANVLAVDVADPVRCVPIRPKSTAPGRS